VELNKWIQFLIDEIKQFYNRQQFVVIVSFHRFAMDHSTVLNTTVVSVSFKVFGRIYLTYSKSGLMYSKSGQYILSIKVFLCWIPYLQKKDSWKANMPHIQLGK